MWKTIELTDAEQRTIDSALTKYIEMKYEFAAKVTDQRLSNLARGQGRDADQLRYKLRHAPV